MALQGTIDSFPVVAVLELLSGSAKTGCLELIGDRGTGHLWLSRGRIVAGGVDGHPTAGAADVVFELLRFDAGSFEFMSDAEPPEEALDADVSQAITDATGMLDRFSAVRETVPDTSMSVELAAEVTSDEVVLDRAEWAMVAAAARSTSVAELAAELGLGEFEGCLRVASLVERGLILLHAGPSVQRGDVVAPDEVLEDRADDEVSLSDRFPEDAPEVSTATPQSDAELLDDDPSPLFGGPLGPSADVGVVGDVAADDVAVDDEVRAAGVADPVSHAGNPPGAGDGFPEHFPIDDLVGTAEPVTFDVPPGTHAPGPPAAFADPPSQGDHTGASQRTDGFVEPAEGELGDHGELVDHGVGDDVLSQIGRLSPKAAEAIAAALGDGDDN